MEQILGLTTSSTVVIAKQSCGPKQLSRLYRFCTRDICTCALHFGADRGAYDTFLVAKNLKMCLLDSYIETLLNNPNSNIDQVCIVRKSDRKLLTSQYHRDDCE